MGIPRGWWDGGFLCFSPVASFCDTVWLQGSKNCFELKRNCLEPVWLGLSSRGWVSCQRSCVEPRFGGEQAAPGAARGSPGAQAAARGLTPFPWRGAAVVSEGEGMMRVCVCERLLMQERVDSSGVVGFSLMGTRVPDVAWNVTAGGCSNILWAFPSFREAFFHAIFATFDLVHLKRASGWTR